MKHYNGRNFKSIGIVGSFRKQMDAIAHAKQVFESNGFEVLAPKTTTITGSKEISFVRLETDGEESPRILERNYLDALLAADVVYVCNVGGYIGATAMFELGYLVAKGQEVFFLEKPQEELIQSLLQNKHHIGTPEEVCKDLKDSNALWNSREWFDRDHEYKSDFSLIDRNLPGPLDID